MHYQNMMVVQANSDMLCWESRTLLFRVRQTLSCPLTSAPPSLPAEYLPYPSAYDEAERLRKILKPTTALAESGEHLDKAPAAEL
jgi:hypothetical protein